MPALVYHKESFDLFYWQSHVELFDETYNFVETQRTVAVLIRRFVRLF